MCSVNQTLKANQVSGSSKPLVSNIKDINTSGGQCLWCGQYGHVHNNCELLR